MPAKWNFFIDRGGTFTDVVAEAPDGRIKTLKLLSQSDGYGDAALEGIRRVLGVAPGDSLPGSRIGEVRMGTTVATNALLERKGEPLVLVTTRGFEDQLRIGYQNRPKLFELNIKLPDMLYARVVAADERVTANGELLQALDETTLRSDLQATRDAGFAACAILFMHGYKYPAHEARAAEIAREVGFTQISTSHETVPLIKFVSRGDTTVADAYLSPALLRYANAVADALGDTRLTFMTSNGGLAAPAFFRGKDAILSGPAGGVVGMAETAHGAGFTHVIGFDMGGTSTDVARFDGAYDRIYETEVAGVRLRAPMMAIHTVAAGGGSILTFDGARFRAGPESAGADPGPKCYRKGGPLTVTDANVMVGKLRGAYFPHIFGPDANEPIDELAVREAFTELAQASRRSPEDVADGFIRVAVENMANAIKKISVAKGYDARDYTLNCFGGAGGQHACLVADALGMTRIFIHPYASLLSAYGVKLAQLRTIRQQFVGKPLDTAMVELHALSIALAADAKAELAAQDEDDSTTAARVHVRYEGSDTAIPIPFGAEMASAFIEKHAQLFGFGLEGRALIAESVEVEATSTPHLPLVGRSMRESASGLPPTTAPHPDRFAIRPPHKQEVNPRFFSHGTWQDAAIHRVSELDAGSRIEGPALLIEPHQTVVVEAGWSARMIDGGALVLTRKGEKAAHTIGTEADPVALEVFANLFMAIAEEMGVTLQNTASSVNIKERLDFSCAVFDGEGGLVANAPHMPVHLGSMGDCVTAILRRHPQMRDGDVFVTNAPYDGGTHLPDVTVVAPVFVGGARRFFVASRGHHADIGGITPGSMPPFSTTIHEEGALFDGIRMVHAGRFDEATVRAVLAEGEWPARNPDQNIADLRAQVAACAKGAEGLHHACKSHGTETVIAYMRHVQDNAEESVRRVIGALSDGVFEMPMDGGAVIRVAITVDRATRSAHVDFRGSSKQAENNFNAPGSVTKAAVLYVFRCLVPGDIPMNAGCLRPLTITVPGGSFLSPRYPGAVAAGNVETSQAVVDALFGCLGVLAASEGTMNNLTFGNARHQYYETICGGAGAGADFDGQTAVHTHMTNSRLTDPEILETRYPVLVESFGIRPGSGGAGARRGGDGTTRRIRFREDMTVALLSTRRETEPFGLNGGEPGAKGTATVIRRSGERVTLKGRAETDVRAGDAIEIGTPGGGGFGAASGEPSHNGRRA
ncbi:MAG TPA: hydantoinase B/oxoprolinase family protein [Rhizomicrobium sp.]|jgi:5-oxoprolinase (ATP-hydrolysing)